MKGVNHCVWLVLRVSENIAVEIAFDTILDMEIDLMI